MKSNMGLCLLLVILIGFTGGCASMISGSTQPVTFKSSPDDVAVSINGEALGKTPTILVLKRQKDNVVEFSKAGFQKQTLKMETKMNGWVLANIIFCFSCLFSTTTDYSTGAAYEYAPDQYFVSLVPEGVVETPTDIKKRKAKTYIIGNYSRIISALAKTQDDTRVSKSKRPGINQSGSSEYLKTLFEMLDIPETNQKTARNTIKKISDETKDVIAFADKVIDVFVRE